MIPKNCGVWKTSGKRQSHTIVDDKRDSPSSGLDREGNRETKHGLIGAKYRLGG